MKKPKTTNNEQLSYILLDEVITLIKSLPSDQAKQIIKSKLTGQPLTAKINGELVVLFNSE